MRSAWRDRYGGTEVLAVREVEPPLPGPDGCVVRVQAATVNRTDCAALAGTPYVYRFFVGWPRPRRAATGTDFAGEVVAVGPGAAWAVGDRVMGFDDGGVGSHAEQTWVGPRTAVAPIPDGVDFETAVAALEGMHYARNFVDPVPLAAGDHVLVYGASGAIGSALVPLLRDRGVAVTTVCGPDALERVASLGADRVVDYTAAPITEQLRGSKFAHVFDAVGKSTVAACAPLLAPGGCYLSSELGPWGQNAVYAALGPLKPGARVRFPVPSDVPRSLALAGRLLASGLRPLVDRRYPLDGLAEAFTYVASGRKVGSVLLLPQPGPGASASEPSR